MRKASNDICCFAPEADSFKPRVNTDPRGGASWEGVSFERGPLWGLFAPLGRPFFSPLHRLAQLSPWADRAPQIESRTTSVVNVFCDSTMRNAALSANIYRRCVLQLNPSEANFRHFGPPRVGVNCGVSIMVSVGWGRQGGMNTFPGLIYRRKAHTKLDSISPCETCTRCTSN